MSKVKTIFNDEKRMLLGGASKTAAVIGIDVIFVRILLAFSFLFLEWEPTAVAYALVSAAFYFAERREIPSLPRKERKPRVKRGSVHDARTKLDARDRRMMAIDHHLSSVDNERLAREIEELREKVSARKAEPETPKEQAIEPAEDLGPLAEPEADATGIADQR